MQILPVEIAKEITKTFLGDALALVNGFVRVATHLVMAPVERIANACDVAGLLHERAARAAAAQAEADSSKGQKSAFGLLSTIRVACFDVDGVIAHRVGIAFLVLEVLLATDHLVLGR